MRITWLFSIPAVLSFVSALAIERRDADFLSVRTHLHKDMSGRKGDPTGKYFHESIFHPHYDGRFADRQLGYRERKAALSNLIQTYLATFSDIGVETWLMHGTLLGWWWNRKILPWDSDSDVQVTEASMHYLATYYNMSVFHYKTPRIPEGRDYMLEINPHYVNREQSDKLNVIDARWVDTSSGLFIDITTARYNATHPAGEGMLSCKDGHEYRDSYIFPLRDTFFEGTPAKIPYAYKEVLEAEYHQKALTQQDFEGHHFDEDKFEWIPVPKKADVPRQDLSQNPFLQKPQVQVPQHTSSQPTQPNPITNPPAQNQNPNQPPPPPPSQPNINNMNANINAQQAAAQPQGQVSPPPPVSKKASEVAGVDAAQKAAEEKVKQEKENSERGMRLHEERRRVEEEKEADALRAKRTEEEGPSA